MARKYTEQQTIDTILSTLETSSNTLYACPAINWKGKTSDTEKAYSEVAARIILEHITGFLSMHVVTRQESYFVAYHAAHKHDLKINIAADSNRDEQWLAKEWYRNDKVFEHIGKIIDHQTPRATRSRPKQGAIDLLAYNEDKNVLYVLELKRSQTDETLLRCVLEAFTYRHTIDDNKLAANFHNAGLCKANATVSAGVIIFEGYGSQPYRDFLENEQSDGNCVFHLARELGVDIFVIDNSKAIVRCQKSEEKK